MTGDLAITVQGIADKPLWDAASTHQHYSTDEDSSGISPQYEGQPHRHRWLRDLSYQIKWESGLGSLTLNGKVLQPGSNGLYTVTAGDINKITVLPGKVTAATSGSP